MKTSVKAANVTVSQLLFKVDGQTVANQRTEPHKSLVSKNVRAFQEKS